MRIAIIAAGSRGDVQPPAGLGLALARRGHTVRLLAPAEFAAACPDGVEFSPLPFDVRAVMNQARNRGLFKGAGGLKAFLHFFRGEAAEQAGAVTLAADAAVAGCDLIIGTGLSDYLAACLGEAHGVPVVHAFLQPMLPSRAFPPVITRPHRLPLPGWYNWLLARGVEEASWLVLRPLANRAPRGLLGLKPAGWRAPTSAEAARGEAMIMAYSRHLLPHPRDWPHNVHVSGFWFLDAAKAWTPPEALTRFLAAGPAPVYVGFGSMVMDDPQATLRVVVQALDKAGCRGVIAAGWSGLTAKNLPDTVFELEEAPHDWLFPRMAAMVHHGGAGTTGAALRAGKPNMAVPFLLDQFFWGWRLEEIGVSPCSIPHAKLTADKLAAALLRMRNDPGLRDRAAVIGEKVRAEDGLGQAIAIIEAAG